MSDYVALIHKDPGSDYGVSFPDFPGCITAGTTLDEARQMAAEALAFHVGGMAEDGDSIPQPSSLEAIMSDPENRNGVAVLVTLSDQTDGSVSINVTLPGRIVEEIDRNAARQGVSRSDFLAEAAEQAIRQTSAA